jgi:uncharacterized protein YdhG (YjbR/CyaY superfamily)
MKAPTTIDDYIESSPPQVRPILEKIRQTIKKAAPTAEERISYRLAAFFLNGAVAYFGAFKKHIGFFPPVTDEKLRREAKRYMGPKGNLQFPLDEPMPYELIRRTVKARVKEYLEKEKAKKGTRRPA